jgi:hypothetical protein
MAEHTPGPWRVAPPSRGHKIIADDSGKVVGEANFYNEQAYANQQLMAAAPTMFDALVKIEAALRSDSPHGPQKNIVGDDTIYRLDGQAIYHAINAARDAIAVASSANGAK